MNRQIILFIFVLLVMGCASTDIKSTYTSAITKIKGEYYLDSEKYDKGVSEFELMLKENPENAAGVGVPSPIGQGALPGPRWLP